MMVSINTILQREHDVCELSELCRFCGVKEDTSIFIFNESTSIFSKIINQHFKDIQVNESDILPLKICTTCYASLVSWHEFHENCSSVDEKFHLLIQKFNLNKPKSANLKEKFTYSVSNDIEVIEVSVDGSNCDDNEFGLYLSDKNPDITDIISVETILRNKHDISKLSELCRLCGVSGDVSQSIFDDDSEIIINYHLNIKISKSDPLPKKHCTTCSISMNSWYKFYQNCLSVNNTFQIFLGTFRLNESKLISPKPEDKVTYSVSNDIEVIEVGVEVDEEAEFGEYMSDVCLKESRIETPNDEIEINTIEETVEERDTKDSIQLNDGNENTVDSESRDEITISESIRDETERRVTEFSKYEFVDTTKLIPIKCSICNSDAVNGQVINEQYVCENCCKVKLEVESMDTEWNCGDLRSELSDDMQTDEIGDKGNSTDEMDMDDVENSVKILPDEKYQCALCGKVYCKKKSIVNHVKNHNKKTHACNICNSSFKSLVQLKSHKKRHVRKSVSSTLIYCEVCKKYFKTKKGFAYHQQKICIQYKCYVCDEKFLVGSVLEDHMKNVHDMKKKSSEETVTPANENETVMSMCPVCGKIVTQAVLPRHMILHSEDKPFTCDLCGKSFKRKHSLQDHIMTEMGMKNFVCDICGMKFLKQGYLNKHVRYHKLNNGEFQGFKCEMCGKKFPEKWRLGVHQRAVHKGGKFASCKCDICGNMFAERWMVRLHKHLEHNGEEFREYQCSVCGKKFLEKWMLRSHQRTTHKSGTKKMYCDLCGRSDHIASDCSHRHALQKVICLLCGELFASNNHLKEHVMSVHNFDKNEEGNEDVMIVEEEEGDGKRNVLYICAGCGKQFSNKQLLKAHEINANCVKESKFECEDCGKIYHSKFSLSNHIMSHKKASTPALYKCGLCCKEFVTAEAWQNHMSLDKICLICDQVYPCNDQLKNHVYTEHSEDVQKQKKSRSDAGGDNMVKSGNPEKPYECRLCGKRFAQKQAMKNHLFAEMNLRRYVCEFCDKSYNYYSHLKEHIVTNHGEKEFVCGYCGKDFPTKKRFRDHVTLHSEDKPFSCECGLSFKLVRYLSKHKKRCKLATKKEDVSVMEYI